MIVENIIPRNVIIYRGAALSRSKSYGMCRSSVVVHQTAGPKIYQYIVQHYQDVSLMKLCQSSVVVHQTTGPIIYQYIVQHYQEVSLMELCRSSHEVHQTAGPIIYQYIVQHIKK